jgi:hypothetical protein
MRKDICQGGIRIFVILALLALIVPVSCKKGIKSDTQSTTRPNTEHIERVKKWYDENWRNSPGSSSRVSPWLHDTNFIVNNYANLVLDWRFARVINQGGYTYTEVPAYTADTLEFKIGPPTEDTTAFLNLMVDSVYRNQTQSKLFWILREAPGENPIAEIITFIGDYQYTKDNYQRFINGICYFDLADYTGVVLYNDRDGGFIRSLTYVRGEITNTIRCGTEGGLDPAPGNRVHLDVCLEILTWERECTTFYSDEHIGEKVCGEWYLVGTRYVGNCFGGGGGSGGSDSYSPMSEDGMDCVTFTFTETSTNWQEAGVINAKVKIAWLGSAPGGGIHYVNALVSGAIIIGLPRFTSGGNISPGRAAEIAAWACNKAVANTEEILKNRGTIPSNLDVENTFRRQVQNLLAIHGGRADRTGGGSPNIVIKNAKYRFLGEGDCDGNWFNTP